MVGNLTLLAVRAACCLEALRDGRIPTVKKPLRGLQESGSSEGDGRATMSHGSAFVSPPSLSGRNHSARDLALSPVRLELPRCGGTPGRARARRGAGC